MFSARKKHRPDRGDELFEEALLEAGSTVSLLVRGEDLYPVHISGNFPRLFGLPCERIQDDIEALYRLMDEDTRRSVRRAVEDWDQGEPLSFDFSCTPDGLAAERPLRCTVVPVLEDAYFLASFNDVSHERQRVAELREQLESLSTDAEIKADFLNRMSHEIRTPLNGILGMLELARSHRDSPDELLRDLDDADELGRFLLTLVNDILDMSRIEAGKVELESKPFDVGFLVGDVRSMFQQAAVERGISFSVELRDCVHRMVVGDLLHVRQVVANLVSNAVKFTPSGGSVSVVVKEMRCSGNTVHYLIRVCDTGKGMDPHFLGRIFRPFEQEDGRTDPMYGGSGLGMAITDSLVKLMGGEIVIDSQLGQGSDFSLYLAWELAPEGLEAPGCALAGSQHEAPGEPSGNAAAESALSGARVLVAEDNDVNARITVSLLRLRGAEVVRARDGKEAVELFESSDAGSFDAVLLDIKMPVMDGWEAARLIRASQHPDAQKVALLALSANAFVEDARRSEALGMDGHVGKPIDFDQLDALLKRAFSVRRPMRKALV